MREHRVLVTGANGFVGQALVAAAQARGWHVRAATRDGRPVAGADETVAIGELGPETDWAAAVADCQAGWFTLRRGCTSCARPATPPGQRIAGPMSRAAVVWPNRRRRRG